MLKQLNVFEAPLNGISLVEASAGTGKTYNITSLYIRAILEKDLLPAQILVLTFTEDATAELKNRLRQRLIQAIDAFQNEHTNDDAFLEELLEHDYSEPLSRLEKALYHFDEASVFTIHGFCNRILNEYSLQFGINPEFKVLPDESQLLQDCVDEYWRNLIRSEQDEKQRFLLNVLIEQDFGPDELKNILSEVINRPFAKLIPDDVDLDALMDLIPEFIAAFEKVKQVSEEELDALKEILEHDKQYKKISKKKEELLLSLRNCLKLESPNIQYASLLSDLGTSLCKGKGGHTFELPEVCESIQKFCETGRKFEALKPAFVQASIQEIARNFEERKKNGNQLSYDDFLIKVNEGLQKDASGKLVKTLSEKYPVALVDEFQDTDPIQYNIFRQIYHGREKTALFMIGDPKQAIYGFRGADIYTYLKAKEDADAEQSYSLNFNYRLNDKMIEAVNEIFSHSESPFHLDLKYGKALFPEKKEKIYLKNAANEVPDAIQCIVINSEEPVNKGEGKDQVLNAVENEIIELLSGQYSIKGKTVKQKDIAILVRTGKEGEEIQQHLRELGIKSILKSNNSVFKTAEAQELFILLQSVQKNYHEPGIRAALTIDLIGKTAKDILHLMENEAEWAQTVQIFSEAKLKWEESGIESVLESLIQDFNILSNLTTHIDAERRITNLYHLSELLAKAEREKRLFGKNLMKWFYRKINDDKLKSEEDNLRLESDENLIQISTIHAAKGLEYPIVFCPFLWTAPQRPDKNKIYRFYQDDQVHIDINSGVERKKSKEAHINEELRESARLLYVALTRSATACYLFLPDFKQIRYSAIATVLREQEFSGIVAALQQCDHIQLRNSEKPQLLFSDSENGQISFPAREFSRKDLFDYPRMLSFSSITQNHSHAVLQVTEDGDFDFEILYDDEPEQTGESKNRFTFPRGATAGTFLHQVFEELSFQDADSITRVVSEQLEYSGIGENWAEVVSEWILETLNHTLLKPDLTLSNLKQNNVLKEMEFHFPINKMSSAKLWELIRGKSSVSETEKEPVSGFMKGFIDLIFRYQDKYYILDYKSNYVGKQLEDYGETALEEKIRSSAYDLQFHIYTLALHRMLRQQLSNYTYESHFGGVLYLFLRGIDPGKAGSAVYFNRPKMEVIKAMDLFFKNEGGL